MSETDSDLRSEHISRSMKCSIEKSKWKINVAKKKRNMGQEYVSVKSKKIVKAKEVGPPCRCGCFEKVGRDKIDEIFNEFWKIGDYELQNSYLNKSMKIVDVKISRVKGRPSRRMHTVEYTVTHGCDNYKVCAVAFRNIHGLSEKRLRTVRDKFRGIGTMDRDQQCHQEKTRKIPDLDRIKVKVVSGLYDSPAAALVNSAADDVRLSDTDVALIKKNVSRAKTVQRARALKSAQAQEGEFAEGEYNFTKKPRTSTSNAETFIPQPGTSTMVSGNGGSLEIYERTEKILGYREPELQEETLTEGDFVDEKFLMTTVKEEPIELPAEEAQAFPLEIQLSTTASSPPAVPEQVKKKMVSAPLETWAVSTPGPETSPVAVQPAASSIPTSSPLVHQSRASSARGRKPCTVTQPPEEPALTITPLPCKALPIEDSLVVDVESERTTQDIPTQQPSIVYFGDESSKDSADVCRLSAVDKSNVEVVLRRLRTEKLLLEIDKLKLEQQKLTAEKTNILLKKSIFLLRKTLMSEDDDGVVQNTTSIVTPPVARARDAAPAPASTVAPGSTALLASSGASVSLHSACEQVQPEAGLERRDQVETGRKSSPTVGPKKKNISKPIQSLTSHSKVNQSQRITKKTAQKSVQDCESAGQVVKEPLTNSGTKNKVTKSSTKNYPTSEDEKVPRSIEVTTEVLPSGLSSQSETSGPESSLHLSSDMTTKQNIGTSSTSDDILHVGFVPAIQEVSQCFENPLPQNLQKFTTPSDEYDYADVDSSSTLGADNNQWQNDENIVNSDCDIVKEEPPIFSTDCEREVDTGFGECSFSEMESTEGTRLSPDVQQEDCSAGTSLLESAQARISKRFQQITQQQCDPEASTSKRMRMDDDSFP